MPIINGFDFRKIVLRDKRWRTIPFVFFTSVNDPEHMQTGLDMQVVDYIHTRTMKKIDDIQKGKIHIFPNWMIEIAAGVEIDLFWNAASFQEMEPETVKSYLGYVQHAKNIYLMQAMYGQSQAVQPGLGGVLQKTQLPHYFDYLPDHRIIDLTHTAMAIPQAPETYPYSDTFWRRVAPANN